jgi:hypothetical protein
VAQPAAQPPAEPPLAEPPPAEPPPAGPRAFDKARFDVGDYLGEAQRLARARLDDAELVHIAAQNVGPGGAADLSLRGYPFVEYAFRSTTRSQRGLAAAGAELECMVNVYVTGYQGVQVEPRKSDKCDEKIIGWPHCAPRQVLARARKRGAPAGALAMLQWTTDFNGQTHWMVSVGETYVKWIEDDCTGDD